MRNSIAALNDAFRQGGCRQGKLVITPAVAALPQDDLREAMLNVLICDEHDFDRKNDPYGEHDFRAFTVGENELFWKIEYFNSDMTAGSENPADPSVTTRVLTVMLAKEY